MHQILEELFLATCPPYDSEKAPAYLRHNPVRAYGQYAFEEGFKLAIRLAAASLADPEL
ncbi:MAG: hypothetical protein K2P20_06845 [Oscillospiraceae bacterium]|nr:hypothetical protein [Oscillospiraceae bacterium]